jgi:hypothetical protein
MRSTPPYRALPSNPAIASSLQSNALVGRVAEHLLLSCTTHMAYPIPTIFLGGVLAATCSCSRQDSPPQRVGYRGIRVTSRQITIDNEFLGDSRAAVSRFHRRFSSGQKLLQLVNEIHVDLSNVEM